jgi:hypothetical protein
VVDHCQRAGEEIGAVKTGTHAIERDGASAGPGRDRGDDIQRIEIDHGHGRRKCAPAIKAATADIESKARRVETDRKSGDQSKGRAVDDRHGLAEQIRREDAARRPVERDVHRLPADGNLGHDLAAHQIHNAYRITASAGDERPPATIDRNALRLQPGCDLANDSTRRTTYPASPAVSGSGNALDAHRRSLLQTPTLDCTTARDALCASVISRGDSRRPYCSAARRRSIIVDVGGAR